MRLCHRTAQEVANMYDHALGSEVKVNDKIT
jgi:hypothetical protein